MYGILLLAAFEVCGCAAASALFPREGRMTRLWLGLSAGLMMMMWLPSLCAFALDFTVSAQIVALVIAAALATAAMAVGRSAPRARRTDNEPPVPLTLLLAAPLVVITAYLQYTHTLLPVNGDLHVGQCTFGDLNLHLGIATGLRGASYPPEYTLLPGTLLGYPFLSDALSSSMLLFGTELRWAFIVPGVLMSALVYWGFVMFAWRITRRKGAVALAFLLLFFNGGLGFFYVLDGVMADPSRLWDALFDFYRAPANLIDHNVRWSNLVCDLLLPQRTFLAGWVALIPALWLLLRAVGSRRKRDFLLLGVWAGAMPMVHTHSFFALGLVSAGGMVYALWCSRERKALFLGFLLYGGVAVALAAPQLFTWTFPQTAAGGSLAFRFNWVNWDGDGLIDEYFWFWLKNVGPVYLLMPFAARMAKKRGKFLAFGALTVYAAAELVQFQPNPYDNNKLFYAAFLAMLPMVGDYLCALWDRLKGLPGRGVLAGVFIAVCLLSGTLSVARECVSDYTLYTADEAEAAAYLDENAFPDAVVLTGSQHNNAVSTLAGRKLVCGTPTFLYFHGVDYSAQMEAARLMYEQPALCEALFAQYGVDYVYVSAYERSDYAIDIDYLDGHFPVWFENGVRVYAVSKRAQNQLAGG